MDEKIIDASEYFTAALSKEKVILINSTRSIKIKWNFSKIQRYNFTRFQKINIILMNKRILMGNKYNIHNPYINWTESKDDNANKIEFFVKNF